MWKELLTLRPSYVYAATALMLATLGSVTLLTFFGRDYVAITDLLRTLSDIVTGLLVVYAANKVNQVHRNVNGRMTELIKAKTVTQEDDSSGS